MKTVVHTSFMAYHITVYNHNIYIIYRICASNCSDHLRKRRALVLTSTI